MILCPKCKYSKEYMSRKEIYYSCKYYKHCGVKTYSCKHFKRKFNPINTVKTFFKKVFKWR